jgi:hypothetical protein
MSSNLVAPSVATPLRKHRHDSTISASESTTTASTGAAQADADDGTNVKVYLRAR